MSSSSPPSKPTLRIVGQSPGPQPESPPKPGDLPPEVMWQAYNHAMLLLAEDLRWQRERDKQKR